MQSFFNYIIENFCLLYNINRQNLPIAYGNTEGDFKIAIFKTDPAFFESKGIYDKNSVIFKQWNNRNIPFLFFNSTFPDKTWEIDQYGRIFLHFDLIAASFYFLSGWEDYVSEKRDALNRFPYKKSIQYQLNISQIPVVNYYFSILKYLIEKSYDLTIYPRLNINKGNLLCNISHDADLLERLWLQDIKAATKKNQFLYCFKLLNKRIIKKDSEYYIDKILNYGYKFKYHPTFYFIPKKGKVGKYLNADYNIETLKYKNLISKIKNSGAEIAMHAPLFTHNNLSSFNSAKNKFHYPVSGNRFHYLTWDNYQSIDILEKAGIKYDSTLGFAEKTGFKNGIAHPFLLYDFKNNKTSKVLEMPMALMDGTLFFENYMNLSFDEAFQEFKNLVNEVINVSGLLVINWHTNMFLNWKWIEREKLFMNILNHLQNQNTVFESAENIYKLIYNNS